MSALDGPMRALAQSLHTTFGKSVTATITTTTDYNPSIGASERSTSTETVSVVLGRWRQHELQGEIRLNDIKATMAALGNTAPTPEHRFTIGGSEYEVVEVVPVYSGSDVAMYKVALRA